MPAFAANHDIHTNPRFESPPMACATSLKEEFSQYKQDLLSLQQRVQFSANPTSTENREALIEVQQTLETLEKFKPEQESATAIWYMAGRAISLLDRLGPDGDSEYSN